MARRSFVSFGAVGLVLGLGVWSACGGSSTVNIGKVPTDKANSVGVYGVAKNPRLDGQDPYAVVTWYQVNNIQTGNVAGFVPLLVMDVWEHAFLLDYKPADRPKYIEAFMSNVDWAAVEHRMPTVAATATAR